MASLSIWCPHIQTFYTFLASFNHRTVLRFNHVAIFIASLSLCVAEYHSTGWKNPYPFTWRWTSGLILVFGWTKAFMNIHSSVRIRLCIDLGFLVMRDLYCWFISNCKVSSKVVVASPSHQQGYGIPAALHPCQSLVWSVFVITPIQFAFLWLMQHLVMCFLQNISFFYFSCAGSQLQH